MDGWSCRTKLIAMVTVATTATIVSICRALMLISSKSKERSNRIAADVVRIRKGKKCDLGQISKLIRDLAKYEHSLDSVLTTRESLMRDFSNFRTAVAATNEGRIVAFAFYSFGYSTWVGKTVALDDLYVDKEYRQRGIGHKLLQTVAADGLEEGAARMEWLSFKWNERANSFYRARSAVVQDKLYYWRLDQGSMSGLISTI